MKEYLQKREQLQSRISALEGADHTAFDRLAMELFRFQYRNNGLYRKFCRQLGREPQHLSGLADIPFLPISTFRHHSVRTGDWKPESVFISSGTTSGDRSKHAVRDKDWYRQCTVRCFEDQYGSVEEWCFLGLLPSYLERSNASLVQMMKGFIQESSHNASGFYLRDYEGLVRRMKRLQKENVPVFLLGVSFALLDLAQRFEEDFSGITVVETGGFKGRHPEWSRSELHTLLKKRWNLDAVHSEYGMTELFSQSYSVGEGVFTSSPTLRAEVYEMNDPLTPERYLGQTGRLHLIDLGNIDTCSFIATDDLGKKLNNSHFTVEGRLDGSMLRGCNLMWADLKKEPE